MRLKKENYGRVGYRSFGCGGSSSVVCKAVSVQPKTEIEGLNIAEDVTQVSKVLIFFFWNREVGVVVLVEKFRVFFFFGYDCWSSNNFDY